MWEQRYNVLVTNFVAVVGTSTESVLGANPQRVALIIGMRNPGVGDLSVAMGWPGGEPVYSFNDWNPQIWRCDEFGPLVSGAWGVRANILGQEFSFTEILLQSGVTITVAAPQPAVGAASAADLIYPYNTAPKDRPSSEVSR